VKLPAVSATPPTFALSGYLDAGQRGDSCRIRVGCATRSWRGSAKIRPKVTDGEVIVHKTKEPFGHKPLVELEGVAQAEPQTLADLCAR
jgi:hypothetical protein